VKPLSVEDGTERRVAEIIGRQVKLVGNHPWAGHRAKVLGIDNIGMRVSLMCSDAMNGHEAYVTKRAQFVAIPKNLETL
jgi:hypothetical protein